MLGNRRNGDWLQMRENVLKRSFSTGGEPQWRHNDARKIEQLRVDSVSNQLYLRVNGLRMLLYPGHFG